jgi:phytoene/squalene synthetase
MSGKLTAVRLLKDLGAEFGCKGDVYVNTEAQMKALDARAKKLKLSVSNAYEVVKADVAAAEADVKDAERAAKQEPQVPGSDGKPVSNASNTKK